MDEDKTIDPFREFWYSQKAALYEIAKQCQYREVIFLDKSHVSMPVRCIFLYKHEHLLNHFREFHFDQRAYNIYISCARFRNTPIFSFNFAERRQQMNEFSGFGCEPSYPKHWAGYDFFMDFDSDKPLDILPAWQDCQKAKDMLDHYQVPYIVTFSGKKGFHLRIPYEYLPQSLELGIVTFCKILGESIHEKLDLKTLDIGVFDERRILKVPYSYDEGNVCLPLTDHQFDNFDIREMKAKNVISDLKIFNRGNLMRFAELPLEQARNNFRKFWGEFK